GVFADSTNQDMTFDLNDARIKNQWTDLRVQARLWFLYPSVGASLAEMTVSSADQTTVAELYGTGINYGLGAKVPLTHNMVIEADAKVARITANNDKGENNAELGERREARVQASFDVFKNYVDLLVGYKARQFSVEVAEQEYKEMQSAPFAG